ncbi:MAG TPA: hypothetical protein VMW17_12335 [Candidatus Binatia bacterium]|nr:hypothetical protein [Candidatus Binatia bacterium]
MTEFEWGPVQLIAGTLPEGMSATRSGSTLSFMFNRLQVELDQNGPDLRAMWFAAIRVPVVVGDDVRMLGYKQDLRGAITKSVGARALLSADLYCVNHVIELPFGEGSPGVPMATDFSRSVFAVEDRLPYEQDPSGFYKLPAYEVRLLLLVERKTLNESASVQLDTLDVAAVTQR